MELLMQEERLEASTGAYHQSNTPSLVQLDNSVPACLSFNEKLIPDGQIKGCRVYCRCIATLKGHESDGYVSALVSAGEHLYSASGSKDIIRVWFKSNLVQYCTLGSGEGGAVKAIVVSGNRLLTAHPDYKIRIWELQETGQPGKLITILPYVKILILPYVQNCLAMCIRPKRFVRTRRRREKSRLIDHFDTISVLAANKNNLLYSGSWDTTVKVWRLSDFKCVESFKAHDDAVSALVVSDDGFVYTASADGKIKVWKKEFRKQKHSLLTTTTGHESTVNALSLSSDGSTIYSGGCGRDITVWQREDCAQYIRVASSLRGHRHAILCLAGLGTTLCSGSADKTIRVWRRASGMMLHTCVAVLQGHRGPVTCVTLAMEKTMDYLVYSGSLDKDIKVWWVGGGSEGLNIM